MVDPEIDPVQDRLAYSPLLAERRRKLPRIWDVLKWQNHTLSIAWWVVLGLALLVIIAAGSRATKK